MSLIFAGISPHPPLLIPGIGKDNLEKVKKTKEALEKMEEELYISKPDVIVVISPHGKLDSNFFTVNAYPNFESSFEEFGDFSTKKEWSGDSQLASTIKLKANEIDLPVSMVGLEKIDHGVTVPLFYLTQHLEKTRILPIGYSNLAKKEHMDFGLILKETFQETIERVAVIASGDLSHGLTTDSPAGFSKIGKEFDEKIIELLETRNTTGYINLDENFIEEAEECAYRSILILLGILKSKNCKFKNLAYEGPFGVGYLTGYFEL